jgi:ubiquinone/menaquinone biosynthesis C-methylase UbiE
MNKERYANLWDDVAVSYNKVSARSRAHQEKFDEVADIILRNKPSTVLDAGCGGGILEQKLLQLGYGGSIVGVDNSKEMIAIATRDNRCERFEFLGLDLNKALPFEKDRFDVVSAINVLFFMDNKKAVLDEFCRVLKNDSTLILVEPKPRGNNMNFFREHIKGRGIVGIVADIGFAALNLIDIRKVIKVSRRLEGLSEKRSNDMFLERQEIEELLSKNFEISDVHEIQAKQNWIFICKPREKMCKPA